MSVWLEIQCDILENEDCYTNSNINPGGLANNPIKSQNQVYTTIKADAILKGWVFNRNKGWFCPSCKEKEND